MSKKVNFLPQKERGLPSYVEGEGPFPEKKEAEATLGSKPPCTLLLPFLHKQLRISVHPSSLALPASPNHRLLGASV